jgi:hypothetical protein
MAVWLSSHAPSTKTQAHLSQSCFAKPLMVLKASIAEVAIHPSAGMS